MGGEWDRMSIMDEAEIIVVSSDDGIDRIYPPKAFHETIISRIHQGGKHYTIVYTTCSQHYRWPQMRSDIKTHVSNCRTCFKNNPAKTEVQRPGLSINMEDLSAMDWLCCDLCEIKDKKGKKQDYLVIVDRYSSFVWAYKSGSTKTKT